MPRRVLFVVTALFFAAACTQDPTGATTNELALAQQAQTIADNTAMSPSAVGDSHDAGDSAEARDGGELWGGIVRRLIDTLRTTNDTVALKDLAQARADRDSAEMARERGDTAAARNFSRLAFRSVLAAVIELFPDAPARTGAVADSAIARIERFLGDRDAPRIRRLLAHVDTLRAEADSALSAGDSVTALALNLRSLQILHRLVEHVRDEQEDHDDVADQEMETVGY